MDLIVASWANIVSLIVLCILLYGRSLRFTNKSKHITFMSLGIGIDIVLIGFLVCFRDAVGQVAEGGMHWTLVIHVPLAISCVVLYFVGVYLGVGLLKGKNHLRPAMRLLDRILIPNRVLVLVTSIMVQYFSK